MSFKEVMFYAGCAVAWFVLLPLFVIGGGIALLGYAVFAELGETLIGRSKNSIDSPAAREIARRMCLRA
jgi:hypothetical protein